MSRWMAFVVISCLAALVNTSSVKAQQTSCRDRTLIANVFDHGSVSADLKAENFQISYRNKPVTPQHASYSLGPRRVIILLDVSGSMRGQIGTAKWQIARLAAWDLAQSLLPGSKLGLVTFAAASAMPVPLSSDRSAIAEWFKGEGSRSPDFPKGRTALYDAVQQAVAQLTPSEPGDSIYVITDGGENASKSTESKARDALRISGVRLFTLLLPDPPIRPAPEAYEAGNLVDMTNSSGGFAETLGLYSDVLVVNDRLQQQTKMHAARLTALISAFYSLDVQLPEVPKHHSQWQVSFVDAGKKRKDAWVGYPREIPPCTTASAH